MSDQNIQLCYTRMTKFERARILGVRAQEIADGAPPRVNIDGMTDAFAIAEKELREKEIPLIVKRTYPNNKIREIRVCDMVSDID